MKDNNCVYLATRAVVLEQFGVDIRHKWRIFDGLNYGPGINAEDIPIAIDAAVMPFGIYVEKLIGNFDIEDRQWPYHAIVSRRFVVPEKPFIGFLPIEKAHVIPVFPDREYDDVELIAAITLAKT